MLITRTIDTPIRAALSHADRWNAEDKGLIACWERGREKAVSNPDMAVKAKLGELVPLPWKGGIETAIKARKKTGTLFYYATWLGLRGDDLDIDTEATPSITCSRFGITVTFTGKYEDYANA